MDITLENIHSISMLVKIARPLPLFQTSNLR